MSCVITGIKHQGFVAAKYQGRLINAGELSVMLSQNDAAPAETLLYYHVHYQASVLETIRRMFPAAQGMIEYDKKK